jgi:hypothetical protein
MLHSDVPAAVLTWDGLRDEVTIPVANMVPDPFTWLAALAAACGTPPTGCHVRLPHPAKVPNVEDPAPPPEVPPPPH